MSICIHGVLECQCSSCEPVLFFGAVWDRFVAYHARRIGIEPDKLVNLIGGAEGLKRDFLEAQEAHVTDGVLVSEKGQQE
jgi:hypothetical protein